MAFGGISVLNHVQGHPSVRRRSSDLYQSAEDLDEMYKSLIRFRRLADPDPYNFVHGVRCLQKWPVHLLSENPQSCVIQYYKRGHVLVRDSAKMEWIYIVKSGSLSVLKKLQEVYPIKEKRKKQKVEKADDTSSEEEEDEYEDEVDARDEAADEDEDNRKKKHNYFGTWFYRLQERRENTRKKRPKLREKEPQAYKNQYEMERRLEQTLPGIYNTRDRLGLIDYDSILQTHRSRVVSKNSKGRLQLTGDMQADSVEENGQDEANIDGDEEDEDNGDNLKLPEIRRTSKGTYLSAKRTRKKAAKNRSKKKSSGVYQADSLGRKPEERENGQTKSGGKMNSSLDKEHVMGQNVNPMFIVVAILEKGNYFGINHLIYKEQPSFSLVSNGAEVIQISRKFFMDKATDETMHDLRCNEVPFPKDDEMQTNLQKYANWVDYRSNVYNGLVHRKLSRDFKRHQYVTQYLGQYCFRTGPV